MGFKHNLAAWSKVSPSLGDLSKRRFVNRTKQKLPNNGGKCIRLVSSDSQKRLLKLGLDEARSEVALRILRKLKLNPSLALEDTAAFILSDLRREGKVIKISKIGPKGVKTSRQFGPTNIVEIVLELEKKGVIRNPALGKK